MSQMMKILTIILIFTNVNHISDTDEKRVEIGSTEDVELIVMKVDIIEMLRTQCESRNR